MGVAGFTTYSILFYTSLLTIVGASFLGFFIFSVSALELGKKNTFRYFYFEKVVNQQQQHALLHALSTQVVCVCVCVRT